VHRLTAILRAGCSEARRTVRDASVLRHADASRPARETAQSIARAIAAGYNLRRIDDATLGVSLDETTTRDDVSRFGGFSRDGAAVRCRRRRCRHRGRAPRVARAHVGVPHASGVSAHRSETAMLRYLRRSPTRISRSTAR
jgi:glycine dehydrogenase